jgi:hypothetical protein
MTEFIGPIVNERFAKMKELGEAWDDVPVRIPILTEVSFVHEIEIQNDMLMWLMSEAKGVEKSLDGLARRMVFMNLPSIHTTSRVRSRIVQLRGSDSIVLHCADSHTSIVSPSCEPEVCGTPPSRDRDRGSGRGLDEDWNG